MIYITIGYMIGIIVGLYLKTSIVIFLPIFSVIILLSIKLLFQFINQNQNKIKNFKKIIIFLIALNIGAIIICFKENNSNILIENLSTIENLENVEIYGEIESDAGEGEYKNYFYLNVDRIIINMQKSANKIKSSNVLDFKNKNIQFKISIGKFNNNLQNIEIVPGDYIKITGSYSEISSYNNFGILSYKEYMKRKNVYGMFDVSKIEVEKNKSNIFIYYRYKVIEFIKEKIEKNIKQNSEILLGILIGDKSEISDEILDDFSSSNISHVLAVSGLHISCIIAIFSFALNKLIKSYKIRKILLIIILLMFLFITGFSASVVRAVTVAIIMMLSKLIHRKNNTYIALAFSCLIILIVNPYSLFDLGFELSFLATIGLLVYVSRVDRLITVNIEKENEEEHKRENKKERLNGEERKIIRKRLKEIFLKVTSYIRGILVVSICANIMTMPILAYNYNTFSLNFLISNIFISPLIFILEMLGIILIFVPSISILNFVIEKVLYLVVLVAKNCSKITFLSKVVITPNFIEIAIYYIIVIFTLEIILNKDFRLKSKIFFENKINLKMKNILALFTVFAVLATSIYSFYKINENIIIERNLIIHLVDVGQGDCIFIETKKKKKILIDGGGNEYYDIGKNILKPYLLKKKIAKLDYIILSHLDYDHCGGIISLLDYIDTKYLILPMQFEEYSNYNLLINALKTNHSNAKIIYLQAGDNFYIDKYTYIQVLWPSSNHVITDNSINNNSLVFKLITDKTTILFTGDIEEKAEKEILSLYEDNPSMLKADILKVAHHGSDTSTTSDILELIDPKIALICVGKNNKYNHPSSGTIEKLKSMNCLIFRTDENGESIISIYDDAKVEYERCLD